MQIKIGSIVATKPIGGIRMHVVTALRKIGTIWYAELIDEDGYVIDLYPTRALRPFKADTVGENEREMRAITHGLARIKASAPK